MRIKGGEILLDFRAKHGIRHRSVVHDRKLARILKNCRELPGSTLFQYLDEDGTRRNIDSGDVNDDPRGEISGREYHAAISDLGVTNRGVGAFRVKRGATHQRGHLAGRQTSGGAVGRSRYAASASTHSAVFDGYLAGSLPVSATVDDLDEFPAEVWEA